MSEKLTPKYDDLLEQAKEVHDVSAAAKRGTGRTGRIGESWSLPDMDHGSRIGTTVKTERDTFMPKMTAEIETHTPGSQANYTTEMSVRPDYTLDAKTVIKRGNYEFVSDNPVFAKKLGEFALKRTGKQNAKRAAHIEERDGLYAIEDSVEAGGATAEDVRTAIESHGFTFRGNEPVKPMGGRQASIGRLREKHGRENVYAGTAFDINGKPIKGMRSVYVRSGEQKAA